MESDWCLDGWLCVSLLFPPLVPPRPTHNPPRNNPFHPPFHFPIPSHHHQIPTLRSIHIPTTTRELNSMASKHARHPKSNGRPLRPRRLYPPIYPIHHPPSPRLLSLTHLTHNIHNNINNTPHPSLLTTFHTYAGSSVGGGFSSDGVNEPVCEGVCYSCLGSLGLVCCVEGVGGFE